MTIARTARRRRRQAANGYRHLAKQIRPRYRKRSSAVTQAKDEAKAKREYERKGRTK